MTMSVIVSTHNRCQSLSETLKTLSRQADHDHLNYEILVVDNNSKDQTRDCVQGFSRSNSRIRYLFEPQKGLSYARNAGVVQAQGEIVVFTDDDCLVDPRWVTSIHEAFTAMDVDALGGKIVPLYPSNTPAWIKNNQELLRGSIVFHDYGEEAKMYEKPMVEFVGANMAFKRRLFDEVGLFHTDLGAGRGTVGEETDFFQRLKQKQKNIYYYGKAIVWHPVDPGRMTLRYIAQWNIALGKYRAISSKEKETVETMAHWFGVPRYLVREIMADSLQLAPHVFDKDQFLKHWVRLSIDIGRAMALKGDVC